MLIGMSWHHRLPREHDGFSYFGLQYYFLNNAAITGELPQWIPYMTHGTVANWWYAIQGGIFVNSIALIAGPLGVLKHLSFLPLFYIGIWFDGLLLLVGTWLLAQRLFRSNATIFFVCAIVVGPCIWISQPWYNFHFFYALPLILALVHRFLDRGSWLSLFLAMNLFALQTIGNLPYFIPISSLVIVLYFGLHTMFNWQEQFAALKQLRFGFPCVLAVLGGLGGLAASYLVLRLGTAEIANYNIARDLDARVSLETFLTYGGEITLRKWIESILGISPSLDNTLYMGLLALPLLAVGGCFGIRRRHAHLHLLCVILFLFGLGGVVATQAYHWWPFMKFYRHIGLTGSVTRIFFSLVAGCGFEVLFLENAEKRRFRTVACVLAIVMLGVGAGLFYLGSKPDLAQRILRGMHTHASTALYLGSPPAYAVIGEGRILWGRLAVSGGAALLCAALLAGRALPRGKDFRNGLGMAALLLVVSDVYIYRYGETWLRTTPLPREDLGLLDFQKLPYPYRRSLSFFAPNPRVEALQRDFVLAGYRHWSTCPFAFVDELGSLFRVDHWLIPLDRFMRLFWGQDINNQKIHPAGLHFCDRLQFPSNSEAALKLSGVMEDKVQFFRHARLLNSDAEVAAQMSNPYYRGDVLFISPGNQSVCGADGSIKDSPNQQDNDRVALDYIVERFDSDNLVLTVRNTTGSSVWLLFSDVWHPGWSATVDGTAVPVYKGALAYKAVQLPPDCRRVHFHFAIRGLSALYMFFGLCSVFWLGILTFLVVRASRSAIDGAWPSKTQGEFYWPWKSALVLGVMGLAYFTSNLVFVSSLDDYTCADRSRGDRYRYLLLRTRPVQLIEKGVKGFNIYICGDRFFGLAETEGSFDVNKAEHGQYRRCIEGASLREVKQNIDCSLP